MPFGKLGTMKPIHSTGFKGLKTVRKDPGLIWQALKKIQ